MGTHGRTGLNHFLIGSVAEKVIRSADVPVPVVRITTDRTNADRRLYALEPTPIQ